MRRDSCVDFAVYFTFFHTSLSSFFFPYAFFFTYFTSLLVYFLTYLTTPFRFQAGGQYEAKRLGGKKFPK